MYRPIRSKLKANASRIRRPLHRWADGRLFEVDAGTNARAEGIAIHLQKRRMRALTAELLKAPGFWITGEGFQTDKPGISPLKATQFYLRRTRRRLITS